MSVYKIYHTNNNNEYKNIYCFVKNLLIEEEIDIETIEKLFDTDIENKIFIDIFSKEEINLFKKSKPNIIFLDEQINFDDTIETIKKKILKYIRDLSFKELYLYAKTIKQLNNTEIFQNLTQNGKLDLTQERLVQFLLNIGYTTNPLPSKEIYSFDDIISLNLEKEIILENFVLGQRFIASTNYIFTINPFDVIVYDQFLETYAENITSTSNKELLLESPNIYENIIYLCVAEDVLQYNIDKVLSEKSSIKIYFPYLFQDEILNLDLLKSKKQQLLLESESLINENFINNNDIIDIFYNLRTSEPIDYENTGIEYLEFAIHPYISNNIPLDIIFKLIHATKEYPMIKYNPSKKQENLYRFYTEKISKDGRKIPFLSKGTIFKIMKVLAKTKKVSVYMEHLYIDETIPIICEFDSNGSIYVKLDFNIPYNIITINEIINSTINPLINEVKNFLEQSGYSIQNFSNLNQSHIEIITLTYSANIKLINNFKLKDYTSCLTEIFNIINSSLDEGIIFRFKKVSNYNEYDAIETFIIDLVNKEVLETDIIDKLIENFKLTLEDAKIKLATLLSSLQVVQNLYQTNKYKIKNNPGFLTTINRDKYTGLINFKMEGINNLNYLKTVPFYLNSLFILAQNITPINNSLENIQKICKKVKPEHSEVDEIVSKTENSFPNREGIQTLLQFDHVDIDDDIDKEDKNLLNILF